MPEYLYHCDSCNEDSSVFKSMSNRESKEYCPLCHRELRRCYNVAVIYPNGYMDRNWKETTPPKR